LGEVIGHEEGERVIDKNFCERCEQSRRPNLCGNDQQPGWRPQFEIYSIARRTLKYECR
jgi:hypothetical protein